jgi:Flp pilus assembly protein TadD
LSLRKALLGLGCLFLVLAIAAVVLVWPYVDPAVTSFLEMKGNLQADNDDLAGAEKSYKAALRRDPESYKALTGLGVVYRLTDRCEDAMAAYEAALQIKPDHADALTSLGVLYLVRGDLEGSIELLERAYALDPTYDVIVSNLAVGYHYAGDRAKRDLYAREARELGYSGMENLEGIFEGEFTIYTGENCSVRVDERI